LRELRELREVEGRAVKFSQILAPEEPNIGRIGAKDVIKLQRSEISSVEKKVFIIYIPLRWSYNFFSQILQPRFRPFGALKKEHNSTGGRGGVGNPGN